MPDYPKTIAPVDRVEPVPRDFPAEHWIHLRTSNPIESTFATVRHRTRVTKAPAAEPPAWLWRSSSSSPPRTGGER